MATQGPTATTYDASSFTNTKAWAGPVTGINAALAAFGWVQTSDSNQIDWTNATVAPFASSVYPNNVLATNATAAGPIAPYVVNLRGNWVSGTTYNYLDVVRSTVGSGGTGNDYILSRTPFIITNVSVTATVATITCPNNLAAGEVVIFPHIQAAGFLLYDPRINNTFTVLASGLSATQFQINVSVETYAGTTTEGNNNTTSSPSMAVVQVTSTTRPETDTKNYIPYYYEIWKTADTQTFSITNVSRSAGGLATFTGSFSAGSSQFKAGYNIVVSGLTNVPTLNGTWCINSATSTQLTVQTGGGTIGSTSDSGTATYTMQSIYLRLEYYNNTANANAPWIRVTVGTGADGNGNLTGNRTASDTCAAIGVAGFGAGVSTLLASSGNPQMDLRGTASPTNPTSTIWRSVWSGANNRFGTMMFYNRNDTNAAMLTGGSIMWVIERGIDSAGNYTDDYFTAIYGNGGATQVTSGAPCLIRYYLKPNPNVAITQVQVDGSNNVTVTYSTNQGFSFKVGSIVYFQNLQTANFLNNQLVRVTSAANAQADAITATSITSNVLTVTCSNTLIPGQLVTLGGTGETFLNGSSVVVLTASTSQFTANFVHANYTNGADTGTATAGGAVTGVIASHAAYGAPDVGQMIQSISLSTLTPIVGTGGVSQADYYVPTVRTAQATLAVNGNAPLLPVHPIPGYVANPMTMAMSVMSADAGAHDTTTTITLYGQTRTYYQGQAVNAFTTPYSNFGNGNQGTVGMLLRWD